MNERFASRPDAAAPDVARPAELELWSNRRLVHPLSRKIAAGLARTRVTPDIVSISGAVMAAAAAAAYTLLPRPLGPLLGFAAHFAWHVLDGADGDLARRTGRSSTHGELVDGICDYLGRTILYLALGAYGSAQFGGWVWLVAVFVGLSRIIQANFYETVRREYRKWVYGADWLRQSLNAARSAGGGVGGAAGGLGRLFLAVSSRVTPDGRAVDAAMAASVARRSGALEHARSLCRAELKPTVKRAAVLSANSETVVIFLSMLAGSPIYLFAYVAVLLNAAYGALYLDQRARLAKTAAALAAR